MKTVQWHKLNICLFPGLFAAILGKAPGQNWEKMIDLTATLGEINDIEHNKGSKTINTT